MPCVQETWQAGQARSELLGTASMGKAKEFIQEQMTTGKAA